MKVIQIIFLAGVLALTSGAVFAEDEIPTFKKADVDGNNFVDEKEFGAAKAAGVEKPLKEFDKDKDGKLSKTEYSVVLEADCE